MTVPSSARFFMMSGLHPPHALLILGLSAVLVGPLGWWVLLSGLARYLLWLAQVLWPWLTGPLPARRWRIRSRAPS